MVDKRELQVIEDVGPEVEQEDGFVKAVDMRHVSTEVLEQTDALLEVKQGDDHSKTVDGLQKFTR